MLFTTYTQNRHHYLYSNVKQQITTTKRQLETSVSYKKTCRASDMHVDRHQQHNGDHEAITKTISTAITMDINGHYYYQTQGKHEQQISCE